MKCCLLSALLLISCSLGSSKALAFVDEPYITPAHPTPERPITVHVRMGGCHGSVDAVDGAKLEMTSPGQLRLITNGDALDPGHPFCNVPIFNYRFNIGALAEGNYTLRFVIRDDLSGAGLVEFGSVSFSVRPAARIPTTSGTGLGAMAILLGMSGFIALLRLREE